MTYQCPKGHISTDSDYCSECGAKIQDISSQSTSGKASQAANSTNENICPDCGTPRVSGSRFCEVCRYDFKEGKTITAEKIVEEANVSNKVNNPNPNEKESSIIDNTEAKAQTNVDDVNKNISSKEFVLAERLNIIVKVDQNRLAQNDVNTSIKPDSVDRIFPLDLDENLVGRRSANKGIYPEIEINDPGVSHRHLKFIKQADGKFAALELGSANGTEYNGKELMPGVNTLIQAGDEFNIGLWTTLKVVTR